MNVQMLVDQVLEVSLHISAATLLRINVLRFCMIIICRSRIPLHSSLHLLLSLMTQHSSSFIINAFPFAKCPTNLAHQLLAGWMKLESKSLIISFLSHIQ